MGATTAELPFLRLNTQTFINLDPTSIILTPRSSVEFIAGTRKRTDGTPKTAQTFKIIWLNYGSGLAPTIAGGETRRFDFILVGNYDALIDIGDHWNIGDQQNEIDYVYPFNGYEVKAGGTSHGAGPSA